MTIRAACAAWPLGEVGMLKLVTEGYAQEIIQAYKMYWEGLRLSDEAYREGEKDQGPYDEHALWQLRMDAAEVMMQAADELTEAVEARAIAAGVNVTDMLYLFDQNLSGSGGSLTA
jgi:hypothetical protein